MNPKTDRLQSSQNAPFPSGAETKLEDGLLEGAIVLTVDGAIPVEDLAPGDRILTLDGGTATLVDIEVTEIEKPALAVSNEALGKGKPEGDILLAADARISLGDWRTKALFGTQDTTICASRIADGEQIRKLSPMRWRMFNLRFTADEIIYADGLEVTAPSVA
ncbi:Hint domain-containing protein [Aestuariibius insulae]|uniref:Hint domain-containing protein n=1 Tax=Aestuariibius insulae TaxID=2058287 RepID=UPI00345E517A